MWSTEACSSSRDGFAIKNHVSSTTYFYKLNKGKLFDNAAREVSQANKGRNKTSYENQNILHILRRIHPQLSITEKPIYEYSNSSSARFEYSMLSMKV
jgi:hypothetical protein